VPEIVEKTSIYDPPTIWSKPVEALLGSLLLPKTAKAEVVEDPFGIAPTLVFPFVVLVWNIRRLACVALLKSPVIRCAVLENVRLPDDNVAAVALIARPAVRSLTATLTVALD
jgi:hypothetical protein